MKTPKLACGVIFAALTIAASSVRAQFPAPPPLPSAASAPSIPRRDPSTEVEQMKKRYNLSEDQAKKVRTILEDHGKRVEAIAKDESLSPQDRINQLLSAREEEIAQISDVMTPEQKEKYQADVHPAGFPKHTPDAELKPPSSGNEQQ